jgi:hypothetical protein
VTPTLQSYADRGVFRGFRAAPGSGGRIDYQFLWLTRKPMSAVFDPRTRTLKFAALFPGVDKTTAHDLKSLVTSRSAREQPAHKRIDARRARVTLARRKGDVGLTVTIRGANHEYAAKSALNLINEMFVMLQEHHPEYLVHQFGLSTE